MAVVGNWGREGYAKAMGWDREDIVRAMETVSEEELEEARCLKGRTRRYRSDVARARHRDPMLREFVEILRRGSPTRQEEIRAWLARREPRRQPINLSYSQPRSRTPKARNDQESKPDPVQLTLPVDGARRSPTAVDLFSGVGGTALGLEWAGFDLRLAVDYDPAKAKWLAKNHPGRVVLGVDGTDGDVRRLPAKEILRAARLKTGELDLLVGCPPCQGFSLQGNREVEDERNYLYRRYLELVAETEPAAVGFENVPGMETLGDGRFLADLLSELDSLGYNVLTIRANARRFGVPQDRERLFVIGMSQNEPPRPREREKERRVGPVIGDLPERTLVPHEKESMAVPYASDPSSGYAKALRTAEEDFCVRNCEVSRHAEGILARFRRLEPGDVDPATHHRRLRKEEPSTTLTAGTPSRTACRPVHPSKDRVLTVREAARLTSFPDWYRFPRQIAEAWCLIGNAVPPLMARDVFRPMWEHIALS